MSTPKFAHSPVSVHAELKKRVNDYFHNHQIMPTGGSKLYLKAIILVAGQVLIYTHLVFFTPVAWLAVLECMLLGLFTSGIGFNIMHDGAHGSFSKHKGVNRLAALS